VNEPQWLKDAREKGLVVGETKADPSALTTVKTPKKKGGKTPLIEEAFSFDFDTSTATFTLPLHVQPTMNGGVFKKWLIGVASKHRKAICAAFAKQIEVMAVMIRHVQDGKPVRCTFTRIGREMDDDNIAACCKQVRDAVALYFGVGDSPKDPIVWAYGQQARMFNGLIVKLELIRSEQ
jgi:hypothetical protein